MRVVTRMDWFHLIALSRVVGGGVRILVLKIRIVVRIGEFHLGYELRFVMW